MHVKGGYVLNSHVVEQMPQVVDWGCEMLPVYSENTWKRLCVHPEYSLEDIVAIIAILRFLRDGKKQMALGILTDDQLNHDFLGDLALLSNECMELVQESLPLMFGNVGEKNRRFLRDMAIYHKGKLEQPVQGVPYAYRNLRSNMDHLLAEEELNKKGYGFFEAKPADFAHAFLYFLLASLLGNASAMGNVGWCYQHGQGVLADEHKALFWYRRGARAHNATCMARLDALKSPAEKKQETESQEDLQKLLDELEGMTGLSSVKKEIKKRVMEIQVKKAEEEAGVHLNNPPMSLHMVFEGNPGTGKTTVARLVGKIYRALGVLDGDAFVECDRTDLVAGFVGQTAEKTRNKALEALGGILFIDEAYGLYHCDNATDYGKEAIDTLVKFSEDYRDKVAIILAGYTREMEEMIENANPGLASRFNKKIVFEDYSLDELCEIFGYMAKNIGLTLEDGAREAACRLIESRSANPLFGNARGVRNVLKDVYDARTARVYGLLAGEKKLKPQDFTTITLEDVLACDADAF